MESSFLPVLPQSPVPCLCVPCASLEPQSPSLYILPDMGHPLPVIGQCCQAKHNKNREWLAGPPRWLQRAQGSKQMGSVGGFISVAQHHHQIKLLSWFSSKTKGAAVFIDPRLHLHGALRLIHLEAATA